MARVLDDLINQVQDENLRVRLQEEVTKVFKSKKFGLVFEEHLPECTPLYDMPIKVGSTVAKRGGAIDELYKVISIENNIAVCIYRGKNVNREREREQFSLDDLVCVAQFGEPIYPYLKPLDSICNAPDSDLWHTLIEADNYHALQLLEYLYAGKIDCIYIDPPYNTGAKDWKYNNNYVDSNDAYRHSKWLSFMKKRLKLAKKLLNPQDSVLIVTIDEKEFLHLGCLLEEVFPEANMQMITDVINPRGTNRKDEFSRVEEYLFICRFGNSSVLRSENNMLGNTDEIAKKRVWYGFNRGNNLRSSANGQFYPIYINETLKTIVEIGEPMPLGTPIKDFPVKEGLTAVFPINDRGNESIWRAIPSTAREWVKKGFLKISQFEEKNNRWTLVYIPSGLQRKIESSDDIALDKCKDGSLNIEKVDSSNKNVSPRSVWHQKYHNATDYGATIIKNIIPNHNFPYPKSLYAEHDSLVFFVLNKPNALILDFFAGSGTTLHAVNLLNAEDGGKRRCILVTNNEINGEEAKDLKKQGILPGTAAYSERGIARYVTWPRTTCSIKGVDINGQPLAGEYITSQTEVKESKRKFTQLSFVSDLAPFDQKEKKQIVSLINRSGNLPQILVEKDCPFIVSEEHEISVLFDDSRLDDYLNALEGQEHIKEFFIVTANNKLFKEAKTQISELLGTYKEDVPISRPMKDGFKSNAMFFQLSFLDKNSVELGRCFKEMLPLLWMKTGAVGKCPVLMDEKLPNMLIYPENHFAVLLEEVDIYSFSKEIVKYPIDYVFLITDSEDNFTRMSSHIINVIELKEPPIQLYSDYLENFKIRS